MGASSRTPVSAPLRLRAGTLDGSVTMEA
jgi:hypothetical protein